ncbi:aldehyde ferredoxin oxidoreductase family protein [Sedimentibacter hydroxybenzoicus DSM 7310]|uniref:Aldehyde ferredoxin oxidoreductase family protein n=1 Tax=Sedimentibacter hydroxybenzoicus DSM 7310 TaxID=1123245 RepID=A0A974GVG4_SEDHY|nr:aldehyde ferredoxin oxidoreductase family protein [Sedimentibacter hydroxybenzoicus]NYB73343.1 aldehyde ferredoxin oxidoreductase family protein [Sedimentibacter hydroxybenzoicus DSM 7310]
MRKVNECVVLHVNLEDKSHFTEVFNEEDMKKYLGGRGIASLILYRDVPKNTDPYGQDNILVFAPGTLVGTNAPTAGRTTVIGKSPATGLFMKANMGGHWGAELKYTGYDALVIHGNSKEWVNLVITDNEILFESADCYLGLGVQETTEQIEEKYKDMPGISVCCIGQSGENLVKYAGIFNSMYNTAARGGLGTVMGAKKIKAISCYGRTGIRLHDTKKYLEVVEYVQQKIKNIGRCTYYKEYGTAGGMIGLNESGTLPVRNFQAGNMDNVYDISGQAIMEQGNFLRWESCFGCTISCKRYCKTTTKYIGTESGGPEYETISVFGAGCEVVDMDACLRANYLTNVYGLDCISTGAVIQWAMETAENGLLPNKFTDPATGIEYNLEFGNAEAMLILIDMIAFRRGIGDLLAEGVKIASERVGGESWKWAVESKGLEQSRVETRNSKAYALAFATNPRGPDHLYGQPMAEGGFSPEMRAIIKHITGDEKYAVPGSTEMKPEIVVWHEESYVMTDALGFCSRATLSTYAILPEDMAMLFESGTGIKMSEDDIFESARRVINLERSFNMREGVRRASDTLPWRLMNESIKNPKGDRSMNSTEELNNMLDQYYIIREWDETGLPLLGTIKKYGLDTIIREGDYDNGN